MDQKCGSHGSAPAPAGSSRYFARVKGGREEGRLLTNGHDPASRRISMEGSVTHGMNQHGRSSMLRPKGAARGRGRVGRAGLDNARPATRKGDPPGMVVGLKCYHYLLFYTSWMQPTVSFCTFKLQGLQCYHTYGYDWWHCFWEAALLAMGFFSLFTCQPRAMMICMGTWAMGQKRGILDVSVGMRMRGHGWAGTGTRTQRHSSEHPSPLFSCFW
ncbi:hypothetical protein F5Y03DRAFT_179527 [Xylaria venustula]|nr:hypothetical protein F5Y03DRAFT_179527 [Xylaria venustula]